MTRRSSGRRLTFSTTSRFSAASNARRLSFGRPAMKVSSRKTSRSLYVHPTKAGREDRSFEASIELALFADRIEDGVATLFELAQVGQPLFQRTQLCIVERAGHFLAIAGYERNRGAAVEQRDRRLDLLLPNGKLLRNLLMNVCHANSRTTQKQPSRRLRGRRLWTTFD